MTRARSFVALLGLLSAACASEREGRVKIADGTYELRCRDSLGDCLGKLATVCPEYGYVVLRAKEEINRTGVPPTEAEFVRSEAVIRCRRGNPEDLPPAPPSAAAPPPVRAEKRCFPGSTQACLGPGACSGAQTCREDGTAFGACDCGASPPGAAPPGTEPPDDAGAPPTWGATESDAGAPP